MLVVIAKKYYIYSMKKLKVWIKLSDGTSRTRRTTVRGFMATFSHIEKDLDTWVMINVYEGDGNNKIVSYFNYPNNTKHPVSNIEVNYSK